MKKLYTPFAGALAVAILLFAGCDNTFNKPETGSGVSALGTVQLSLAVQSPRTLVPDTGKTLAYKVTAQSGAATQTVDENWNGTGTKTVPLNPGAWTITVTGFFTEEETTVDVSQGQADVTITANQAAGTVTINLTPLGVSEGVGSFKYGGLNFTGLNLTSGTLTLASATDSSAAPIVQNLLAADYSADSVIAEIPAGYYWLTVKLGNASGYAVKSELVHIYQNRTTNIGDSTVFVFSTGNFSRLLAASFTVSAEGTGNTVTTKLVLTFTPAITDIAGADIAITPAGAVTTGNLTASSTAGVYELAVSNVTSAVEITVAVNRTDYEIASRQVTVIPAVTLTFNTTDGSDIAPVTIGAGSQVAKPDNPTKENNTFDNWYTAETGGSMVSWPLTVNANTTVYARWNATLTFNTLGGSTIASTTVTAGSQVTRPAANPTRANYIFDDWYTAETGGSVVIWPLTVGSNTTVYARWIPTGQGSIKITFSGLPQDETTTLSGTQSTLSQTTGTINLSVPTASFTGASYQWFADGNSLSITSSSLSRPGSDFSLGRHEITVRIKTTDNKVFSKTLRFTVVQ